MGKHNFQDIFFGLVPEEHWKIPNWINKEKMIENTKKGKAYSYKTSITYRQMCRYFSGFFFKHPLLDKFDHYWRVEPNVDFFCKLQVDPFVEMYQKDYFYSFTIAFEDEPETIPTLGSVVKNYVITHNITVEKKIWDWLYNSEGEYTNCHFWSNFEIGNLNFFRSKEYNDFFNYLDRTGGFFYERWGDAPVHTFGVGIFLNKSKVKFWDEIGYMHGNIYHLPLNHYSYCKSPGNFLYSLFFRRSSDTEECLRKWLNI